MNHQQRIESHQQIQQYLQQNKVYQTFRHLTQQIMLNKPSDLIDFIIKQLQSPQKCVLFVVGPPGLSINNIIKKALQKNDRQFQVLNCGQEISKIQNKLSNQDKDQLKKCQLISSQSIQSIIKTIQQKVKSGKDQIIQGFPKNLKQSLQLQKKGIYVKNILIINVNNEGLQDLCRLKINKLNPEKSQYQKSVLIEAAMSAHKINIRQIKNFYKEYLQIDLSFNRQQRHIVQELDKAFSIKTINTKPRKSSQIIIVGAPFSGRTILGKKLAAYYNFVYISTKYLIAQEIRKQTIHGRKIKNAFIQNQLIDSFLIEKLIEDRITKKDSLMQGFVLQGYPKNKQQFQNIKNMKLNPTMFVAIDIPQQLSERRNNQDKIKHKKRYQNWSKMSKYLKQSKQKIFWVNPLLNIQNTFEEVIFQFQKSFI